MNQSFHTTRVLVEDGKLELNRLPFTRGDAVEIFISVRPGQVVRDFSLRGTVANFENPTEPVGVDDWIANQ